MLLVPCDVRIAQQRDEIVGNRAADGVLKIEDAGIGIGQHQVARMVIAVDVDPRLREIVVEDETEGARERCGLAGIQFDAEMLGDIPVGKEIELAASNASSYGGSSPGRVARCQRISASLASA